MLTFPGTAVVCPVRLPPVPVYPRLRTLRSYFFLSSLVYAVNIFFLPDARDRVCEYVLLSMLFTYASTSCGCTGPCTERYDIHDYALSPSNQETSRSLRLPATVGRFPFESGRQAPSTRTYLYTNAKLPTERSCSMYTQALRANRSSISCCGERPEQRGATLQPRAPTGPVASFA
ncbi:hypothetical protein C8Q73DRAFT_105115 [Cubamyces lactineus]|nr:hypothetical protein C8Q73DRAFT_105115 [Cubamyces lactineus]